MHKTKTYIDDQNQWRLHDLKEFDKNMLTPISLKCILQKHYQGNVDHDFFQPNCNYQTIVHAINGMRLEEIKKVLREIKSLPDYHSIPLDRNKPVQIEVLSKIVHNVLQLPSSATTHVTTTGSNIHSSSSNISHGLSPAHQLLVGSTSGNVGGSTLISTSLAQSPTLPHHITPNYGQSQQYPRMVQQQLHSTTFPNNQSVSHSNAMLTGFKRQEPSYGVLHQQQVFPLAATKQHPRRASTASVSLNDRNSILNTALKKDIFYQLSVVSGITKQDILMEIRDSPPDQLSKDNVLLRILSRKDPHGKNFANYESMLDSHLKQQEDAAMDRAILESEKERDNIQMRKKRRVDDLKNNIQAELISAEEFKKSILLHGVDSSTHTVGSSSSNTSSQQSESCLHGSTLIRLICLLYEHFANNLDPVELVMLNSSNLRDLRKAVAEILLLEADTVKYYKDAAFPYLMYLADQIDSSRPLPVIPHADIRGIMHSKAFTKDVMHITDIYIRENCDFFCTFLNDIVGKFQKGLCKIPKDGGLIPDMLRQKHLIPYINMLNSQIDQDGFELVDSYKAMKLVSDDEGEDIEGDDDFDYYSDC